MVKKRIGAPLVEAGPQYDFFVFMQDLVLQHGDHSLQELARRSLRSRQVVHRALRGPDLPNRDLVRAIVQGLFSGEPDDDNGRRNAEGAALSAWTNAVEDQTRRSRAAVISRNQPADEAREARERFAAQLRKVRSSAHLEMKLESIAIECHCSTSSVSAWLNGKTLPDLNMVNALLKILNASRDDAESTLQLWREAKTVRRSRRELVRG